MPTLTLVTVIRAIENKVMVDKSLQKKAFKMIDKDGYAVNVNNIDREDNQLADALAVVSRIEGTNVSLGSLPSLGDS